MGTINRKKHKRSRYKRRKKERELAKNRILDGIERRLLPPPFVDTKTGRMTSQQPNVQGFQRDLDGRSTRDAAFRIRELAGQHNKRAKEEADNAAQLRHLGWEVEPSEF